MSKSSPFSRGVIGIPTIVIAAMWVGLWGLLPRPVSRSGAPELPEPRVTYSAVAAREVRLHMAPHLFALPSPIGFSPNGDQARPEPFTDAPPRPPRYLDRDPAWTPSGALAGSGESVPSVLLPERSHSPWYVADPVFRAPEQEPARMFYQVSAPLEGRAFKVPDFAGGRLPIFDKPWQVRVHVDLDEEGRVKHVLLESGCDDPAINAMVIREMYRGRGKARKGSIHGGSVTVGFSAP